MILFWSFLSWCEGYQWSWYIYSKVKFQSRNSQSFINLSFSSNVLKMTILLEEIYPCNTIWFLTHGQCMLLGTGFLVLFSRWIIHCFLKLKMWLWLPVGTLQMHESLFQWFLVTETIFSYPGSQLLLLKLPVFSLFNAFIRNFLYYYTLVISFTLLSMVILIVKESPYESVKKAKNWQLEQ